MKRIAVALAVALISAAGPRAEASSIDAKIKAQQAHAAAVQAKLAEKRAQLHDARAKVGSLQEQLAATNRNIANVSGNLAQIEARIRGNQRKIAWTRVQLGAARATLARHDAALKRRLVDAYEHGDLGYIEVLLASRSFSDFVERWNDIRFVIRQNQATIRARRADEARVRGIEHSLLGVESALEGAQEQARQQRFALVSLAEQRRNLLQAADAERGHVAAEVAALDEESAEAEASIEQLIRQKQAEEEARRAAARRAAQLAGEAVPPSAGAPGSVSWPLSGPITSPFGMRTNPVTGRFILHAGIDIGVPTGTTVGAAADGRVIVAGWDTGGCGNMIVIDHGGHLSTQYCHLSQIYVGEGQDVQRGQAIAASGSTGNSTGPHLHFGVRVDGHPVDPMTYLR